MLQIGELAERTGKSVHALRYYESEGLIPNVARDDRGRRIYVERHVMWVELLVRLRRTGMSMADVRRYATLVERGDETLRERQRLLRAHRERVERQIGELEECVDLIDTKVSLYQGWLEAGGSPIEVPGALTAPRTRSGRSHPA